MKWFFQLGLFLLLSTSTAFAVGEICGDGVDNDSSGGDLSCPAPDADRDGYYSDGAGPNSGTDCDDSNRYVYTGIEVTSGCSAGQYKTCQSSGSYTSCSNISAFTCHSGSGATYWFDDASGSNSNSGSYASPKQNFLAISNPSATGYHAPVAGDCFVFKAGTYNDTWNDAGTTRMLHFNNKDGTSSNHITIRNAPGDRPVFSGAGSSPTQVIIVDIVDSDYVDIHGLEISDGYSNSGIYYHGGSHSLIDDVWVHDIDGDKTNNTSCIKTAGASSQIQVRNSLLYDCYDRSDATNENNAQFVSFEGTDNVVNDNVIYATVSGGAGKLVKYKHGQEDANWEVKRNVIYGAYQGCIEFGQPNATIKNNYLEDCNQSNNGISVRYADLGGDTFFDNAVIQYNTIKNSPFIELIPTDDYAAIQNPSADIRYNVVIDNRGTSYPSDASDGFIRICHYCSDALYTDSISAGVFTINSNCYYNSTGTALFFSVFGDNGSTSSGATYSSFSSYQSGSGFDSLSYQENPSLDSYGRATSTHCSLWGWSPTASISTSGFSFRGRARKI